MLDEMSGVQSEGRGWPVEVLIVTTQAGDIIVLNRCMSKVDVCLYIPNTCTSYFQLMRTKRSISGIAGLSGPTMMYSNNLLCT